MSPAASALQALVNRRIARLGKTGYEVDPALGGGDLVRVVGARLVALARGALLRRRLGRCGRALFVGQGVRVVGARHVRCGDAVTLEDRVEIHAVCRQGVILGSHVTLKAHTIIECTGVLRELGEGLTIGDNVGITQHCFIQVRGRVRIGNNVMFGPGVRLFSENHGMAATDTPMIAQPTTRRGVTVGDDVWVGAGATILDGVTIGSGSVVAAASLVRCDVPPRTIVAGVPARAIGQR